ncbi:TPA: ATP-dependent DNA ligase [Vibrio parahaemolyticus]|nr:ATP-dependent DNA ligase [Vibrio parahaemolyticus]
MIKPKLYKGGDLSGLWEVTYKIDGVRALKNEDGQIVSRNGKPLYNLDHLKDVIEDAEIYLGSWEDTISAVRSLTNKPVPRECVYSLQPDSYDKRLFVCQLTSPSSTTIDALLQKAIGSGYEGLVLRKYNSTNWLKVKPIETYDVVITGFTSGTGRNSERLGALITPMGKVSSGLTDELREVIWNNQEEYLGQMIEVEAMELTKNGKFRHPRLVRFRPDKG